MQGAKRQMPLTVQAVIALNVGLKADDTHHIPPAPPWSPPTPPCFLSALRVLHSQPCHCRWISVGPPPDIPHSFARRTTYFQLAGEWPRYSNTRPQSARF